MRVTALLAQLTAVSAAVLSTRQFDFGKAKFAGTDKLTPELRPDAVRQISKFGPYTVKGKPEGVADSGQQNSILTISEGLCKNCTVLKGRVGLILKDGAMANVTRGVYIHHVLSTDYTKPSKPFVASCNSGLSSVAGLLGSKFMGTGDDQANIPVWYASPDGKYAGGFHLGPKDTIIMNVDLVNSNTEQMEVYLTMEMEYLPGIVGSDTRDTLLSVTGCGENTIKISETAPTNTTSGKYTWLEDGTIVFAKGHLHSGGEKMVMEINDKVVCESKARYGNVGTSHSHAGEGNMAGMADAPAMKKESIVEMGYCNNIAVKKGDTMKMTAVYDASKHPIRHESAGMAMGMPDVMGMWAVAFGAAPA